MCDLNSAYAVYFEGYTHWNAWFTKPRLTDSFEANINNWKSGKRNQLITTPFSLSITCSSMTSSIDKFWTYQCRSKGMSMTEKALVSNLHPTKRR